MTQKVPRRPEWTDGHSRTGRAYTRHRVRIRPAAWQRLFPPAPAWEVRGGLLRPRGRDRIPDRRWGWTAATTGSTVCAPAGWFTPSATWARTPARHLALHAPGAALTMIEHLGV